MAVNTRVPDTESELEGETDQPKARRTSRGRVPAPEKGRGAFMSRLAGNPAARPSPVPARSGAEGGERRGRTKGFYTQKDPFTGENTTPRVRLRSGGPGTPASPPRDATGSLGGRGGYDPRDDDNEEWELPPGVPRTTRAANESRPHRDDDRSRTALGAREERRGPKGEGKGRGKHRPGKGGREDPGPPRQRDDRGRDTRGGRRDDRRPPPRHEEPSERRGPGRDERRGRDDPADDRTGTGAGMTDVTNQIPLRLADLRLATTVGVVVRIAVGMEEAIEVTAVDAGETTRPVTGKNPVQGGRQVPQSASALEGRGWHVCRRKTRPRRSSSRPCGTAGGDGLHCPVPLIRRCSCPSRTAAVRAGDGSPGDPV